MVSRVDCRRLSTRSATWRRLCVSYAAQNDRGRCVHIFSIYFIFRDKVIFQISLFKAWIKVLQCIVMGAHVPRELRDDLHVEVDSFLIIMEITI